MKYLFSLILFLSSSLLYAGVLSTEELDKLTDLLSDQYSVLVKKSISEKPDDSGRFIYVTFTIEGFSQGNNHQQYLAVYISELKKLAEPPFSEYGEPKYRLVGFRNICNSPLLGYKAGSLVTTKGEVTGVCAPLKTGRAQEKVFTYRVGRFGVY
ncbi:MAG: hypothetical protein HWE26_22520 [Alteromonadaceae bacterium]|nr:hypothetical protein [Alteromonadaceae bacterium]